MSNPYSDNPYRSPEPIVKAELVPEKEDLNLHDDGGTVLTWLVCIFILAFILAIAWGRVA